MIIQISSGQGPAECELAVYKLFQSLKKEYPDIELLSSHESRSQGGLTSVLFFTECDLSDLEGSVQWICKSPYRPHHKRKNWFVDVSVIPEKENICKEQEIRFERFHSGGKGGQNVNKVETGVRIIHLPTGLVSQSTEERSQFQNKQRAMEKLQEKLAGLQKEKEAEQVNAAWREHTRIVRGNPVRIYEGKDFVLKRQ